MNESFHDYEKKDETVRAMEGLTGLKEAPKNVSQLQMLLIEEYFLSQPGNQSISPEEFSKDNNLQAAAGHLWIEGGLSKKFRLLMNDPKHQQNPLGITLDDVLGYKGDLMN